MLKINWKVRLRHRQFWLSLISALVLIADRVAAIFGVDIMLISAEIQEVLESILLILALFGIIIDPTTAGVKDSSQAMVYSKPRDEKEEVLELTEKGENKQEKEIESNDENQ